MRVREKVGFAVRARLEYLMPHREAMRRLIMWYALPMHAVQGIKLIAKTADLVWQAAGDTSTDYNFYTKRMLLAAVMKATLLYWLNDQSAGCSGTWEFLDRRLAEVVRAGKAISLAREYTPSEVIDMVRKKFAQ
jgi:ubiquinone biosynthesis protein COQ9